MTGTTRLQALTESETLAMAKKVRRLIAEGKDVVGLTLGEPDFDTPEHIREAAIQALHDGHTHYPPVAGIPALRQAVADKFQREYGLDMTADNVLVSTGAKQSLVNIIMSLVNPGEHALLIAPYWVSYREMLKMAEAEYQVVTTGIDQQFKISPAQLEEAIGSNTRLLILTNPSNPTGSAYSREELAALVEVIEGHPQLYVISDEIYEYIAYDHEHTCMAEFGSIRDRVVIVNGVSKGFAMTGWRIGFTVGPAEIIELCEKYQGQVTSGANTIAQHAALKGLTSSLDRTRAMRDEFRERRDYVYEQLSSIEGMNVLLPPAAFYFYPDVSAFFGKTAPSGRKITDIQAFCDYLLDEALVAVISGSAFGTDRHVRISYAYNMDMLTEGMRRMKHHLSLLQ